MRIEASVNNATPYSAPVERINTEKIVNPVTEIRTNFVEIKDHVNQTVGYQPTIQEKLIIESIETANRKILGPQKEFEFSIHKQTKQIMVKIIDKNTKEIIREIPPEKVLDAVAHMWEMAGLFMDEKR